MKEQSGQKQHKLGDKTTQGLSIKYIVGLAVLVLLVIFLYFGFSKSNSVSDEITKDTKIQLEYEEDEEIVTEEELLRLEESVGKPSL